MDDKITERGREVIRWLHGLCEHFLSAKKLSHFKSDQGVRTLVIVAEPKGAEECDRLLKLLPNLCSRHTSFATFDPIQMTLESPISLQKWKEEHLDQTAMRRAA